VPPAEEQQDSKTFAGKEERLRHYFKAIENPEQKEQMSQKKDRSERSRSSALRSRVKGGLISDSIP